MNGETDNTAAPAKTATSGNVVVEPEQANKSDCLHATSRCIMVGLHLIMIDLQRHTLWGGGRGEKGVRSIIIEGLAVAAREGFSHYKRKQSGRW